MGGGSWDVKSYTSYNTTRGVTTTCTGDRLGGQSATEMFRQRGLHSVLNPCNTIRECCDSDEHPCTVPVILGLDVTGSMGTASVRVAEKLNTIMTLLYNSVKDVEFMIMGIGDLSSDNAPIQASQFESDVRIAEQLDKIYFEGNGGSNGYESYTSAWYYGLNHTKLDCLNRGRKALIITMGDEPINPYLPKARLNEVLGDDSQCDVNTNELYNQVTEKFEIHHITINDRSTAYYRRGRDYAKSVDVSWKKYLDDNHYHISALDELPKMISDIVKTHAKSDMQIDTPDTQSDIQVTDTGNSSEISW